MTDETRDEDPATVPDAGVMRAVESFRHSVDEPCATTEDRIVARFESMPNTMMRYLSIVEVGRRLPAYPLLWETDAALVPGCQSKVWLSAIVLDGRIHVRAKSDSAIVSGFLGLLIALYDQRRPEDILAFEPSFAERLGLGAQMAPTRANGLAKVIERINELAAQ